MAWAAVRHQLESVTWLIFAATVFWAVAYDTIYAMQDKDDDHRIGVKSSALLFGSYTWLGVGIASLLMLICLGVTGWILELGSLFYVVLFLAGASLAHQVYRVCQEVSPNESFALFKQHVWIGVAILGGIWLGCQS